MEEEQSSPDFYSQPDKVSQNGKKLKSFQNKIEKIKWFDEKVCDLETYCEFVESGEDEMFSDLQSLLRSVQNIVDESKISILLNGKYDNNNAIINIHAGAGGTEAQDWADMLYRMYSMFANKQKLSLKVLDVIEGDEAGLKNISFLISGENAYGYLQAEKGIHRLVRISPFDSNSRRHTSFASVEVMPEIEDSGEIEIKSDDLKIDTYRASGAGGQHVNKTDSAIRITHIPTGIICACQTERSQLQNKETAMKMLRSRLAELKEQQEKDKMKEIQGQIKKIEWGSQIRSYVFCPYTLVKDHRTGFENSNVNAVMDGEILPFINDYLKKSKQ